eukprot:945614-Prymnesium_polylepis.1
MPPQPATTKALPEIQQAIVHSLVTHRLEQSDRAQADADELHARQLAKSVAAKQRRTAASAAQRADDLASRLAAG